jgi:hypothetical protein
MANYKLNFSGEEYDESVFSGDDSEGVSDFDDRETEGGTQKDIEKGLYFTPHIEQEEESTVPKITPARKKWVCCTWFLTWWIPVSAYRFGFPKINFANSIDTSSLAAYLFVEK